MPRPPGRQHDPQLFQRIGDQGARQIDTAVVIGRVGASHEPARMFQVNGGDYPRQISPARGGVILKDLGFGRCQSQAAPFRVRLDGALVRPESASVRPKDASV